MEFLAGSTFEIGTASQDKAAPAALFLKEESNRGIGLRRCVKSRAEEVSESSSSVGVSGESSENEEEEEDGVVSSQGRWLDSFGSSLEDSLPIKRGLSNHYIGKSKSFGNLMEATSNAKDLEKAESPLNKRRRLLIANKLRRRSSLSSFSIYSKTTNLNSMPLLALQESNEDDQNIYNYDKDDNNDDDDDSSDEEINKLGEKRMKMTNNRDFMVQTQSCFCLSSFQDDDR